MKKIIFSFYFVLFALVANAGGIKTAEDLVGFAKAINEGLATDQWRNEQGAVLLEADIDMAKVKKWESIKSFGGLFDGQGYKIMNWKSKSGLFAELLQGGIIRNIVIDASCSIKATNPNEVYYLGFIAHRNNGIIENCTNKGSITHKSTYTGNKIFIGGLVGYNRCLVVDCTNTGNISSNCVSTVQQGGMDIYIGGIVGSGEKRSEQYSGVFNCHNEANISYEGDFPWVFVGGIIGADRSRPIRYCTNKGNVKVLALAGAPEQKGRTSFVGGICGQSAADITSCDNFGDVSSAGNCKGMCGGIAAQIRGYLALSDCMNYGKVSLANEGQGYLGGIAGSAQRSVHFSFCENYGEVTYEGYSPDQPSYNGGIVGEIHTHNDVKMSLYMRDCINHGKIHSGSGGNNFENDKCILTGGLAGKIRGIASCPVYLNGCINNGKVSSITGKNNPIVPVMGHTKILGTYTEKYACSADVQADGSNVFGKIATADGKPIKGVVVSDGLQCVTTGDDGTYSMTTDLSRTRFVFMSIPSGYEAKPVSSIPQFFKRIRRYEKAVCADFVLTESGPQDEYTIIMIGDPQMRGLNMDDSGENFRDVVIPDIEEVREAGKPMYAITLGDVVYNFVAGYDDYLDICSTASFPIFNLIGNHDVDPNACYDPYLSKLNFENYLSPTDYSFNIGDMHYVVLNSVPCYQKKMDEGYTAGITDEALEWLKSDLSHVSKDKTIVLCSHILLLDPWRRTSRRQNAVEMSKLLEPYKNVYAWGGHWHTNFGGKYKLGKRRIDGVKVARCIGSPRINKHLASDGTTNGYMHVAVKGGQMEWYYKTIGHDRSHQMRVYSPTITGDGYVKATIWNYTKDYWTVPEWYENGVKVGELEKVLDIDPAYKEIFSTLGHLRGAELENATPLKSEFMFRIKPSEGVRKGEVRVTDNFGVTYTQEIEW